MDQRAFEQAGVILFGPDRGGADAFSVRFRTKLQQKMSQVTLGESLQVGMMLNVIDDFFPLGELTSGKRR